MSSSFQPRLDILPSPQRRLWNELGTTPSEFTLYGGTALALRLGHRQSEDFDFFSRESFDAGQLHRAVAYLQGARIDQVQPNTLTCAVDLERLEPPDPIDPGVVASLADIAATKMRVVQMRAAAKDHTDIVALLDAGLALSQMLDGAGKVFGHAFNPLVTLKALSYFGDGDLPSLPADVKDRLSRVAAEIL